MLRQDAKGKRKAEGASAPLPKLRQKSASEAKLPSNSAAWATAFISEVSSAAQLAIEHTALGRGASSAETQSGHSVSQNHHPAVLHELQKRISGDADDFAGDEPEPLVFSAHGRVFEVSGEGPLLQAETFLLRRQPSGELSFLEEDAPIVLASSEAASSRALAAVSVLDCSCGLVRPSILHQCGDAVQLSALDTARRAAHPVVRFQLAEGAKAAVQACHIADGPTVVIECEQQSLLVAFRASQPAEGTSSCRPAATEGPSTPGASTEEQGGWQVHKLQLPGQCRQRFLLRTGTDSNRAAPGRYRPLLCLSMGCKCGAEGGPHALLELQHIPGEGWTALEFIQAAAVRPAAVCQVLPPPEAASAALAAGFSPPAPRLAVATAAGDVLALSAGSAQHQLHTVLRALPEAEVVEERGADGTASGGGCGGLVGKILRSNLTERMQRQTESTGQPQTHSAACKLLAKTRLAHTAQRLICAPEGTGGQIIAVSGDKGGTLCCLEWPQLQPRCQLYGVSAVTADPVGLGICIHGQEGWLGTVEEHNTAVAILGEGHAAGTANIVRGMRRPAVLLPQSDVAAGKGMAEAAEGMRAVLGALRRRLEDGCTALQEAEQLHGRKAALAHRSMQLLHAHCLSTLRCVSPAARQPLPQPLPAAAAAAASDRGTQPSAGGSANSARMSEPPVPLCTALSAALEGASCVVRARLWDDSCSFDLESAQLLVSLADGPITAFPQPTQQAAEQTGSGRPSELERQQRGGGSGVSMSTRLDIQGLVASSSRAPLDVIAIVPLLSHRLNSASDPRAATEGLHQQCSYHMQHLGSLRLDWPEMLRCQEQPASRQASAPQRRPTARGDGEREVASNVTPKEGRGATEAAGSTAMPAHHGSEAEAEQAESHTQSGTMHEQSKIAGRPKAAYEHLSLCLEAEKGSIGDVPKALESALGLRLDWLTSHGACLSSSDGTTVSLAFHGRQHAELTVRSASATSCRLMEQCICSSVVALGIKVEQDLTTEDDFAALSQAIRALSVEVNACMGLVGGETSSSEGAVSLREGAVSLKDVRECVANTDLCYSMCCLTR